MIDAALAVSAYVAGMSTGFSGNMGFPMPTQWHYNQIVELGPADSGVGFAIDKVVVSRKATAVDPHQIAGPPSEQHGAATTTGFDVLFQWYADSVTKCQLAVSQLPSDQGGNYAALLDSFVLSWLRKPRYWGKGPLPASKIEAFWRVYTPEDTTSQGLTVATTCQASLGAPQEPLRQDGSENPDYKGPRTPLDVMHWAASVLGYLTWGLPDPPSSSGLGDLGAWGLDLYSLFGQRQRDAPDADLSTWLASHLGAREGSSFGYNDLLADSDAWLAAHLSHGSTFLEGLRATQALSPSDRLKQFYQGRFKGSADNIGSAFKEIVDGT